MKNSLVFLIINFFFVVSYSQSISVLDQLNTEISNDTVYFNTNKPSSDFTEYFSVRNNTASSEDIKVLFNIEKLVSHTGYGYCWNSCFSNPNDGDSSGITTIDAGITKTNELSVDYSPVGYYGTSSFKFTFYSDNLQDSTYIVVVFNVDVNSINETSAQNISVYPNPCDQYFNIISETNNNFSSFELLDVFGNKIFSDENSGNNLINTGKISNGLYILKVKNKSGIEEDFRIVVNH